MRRTAAYAAAVAAAAAACAPSFAQTAETLKFDRPALRLSALDASHSSPVVASGHDGLAWTAYMATASGGDRIVANYSDGQTVSADIEVCMAVGIECSPAICPAQGGGAWVAWAALRKGEWRIILRQLTTAGAAPQELVAARGPEMLARPAVAAEPAGDAVWVVWEKRESDGAAHIYARRYAAGRFEPELLLSAGRKECYRPAVAVEAGGRVWFGWDFYENRRYMIALRSYADRALSDELRLGERTEFLNSDLKLLADPRGGLWAFFSTAQNGRLIFLGEPHEEESNAAAAGDDGAAGGRKQRQQRAREGKENKEGRYVPAAGETTDGYGYPRFAFDKYGRLWFTNIRLNVWSLEQDKWLAPADARPDGPWNNQAERAAIGFAGDRLVVVWEEMSGKISLRACIPPPPASEGTAFPKLTRPKPPEKPDSDAGQQQQPGRQPRANPTLQIGEKTYRVLWGDLHTHNSASEFWGFADWRCNRARDALGLDFIALTDHDSCTPDLLSPSEWVELTACSGRFNATNRFSVFPGWEWSGSGLSGRYGHKLVICRSEQQQLVTCFSRAANRPDRLYALLGAQDGYVIQAGHHSSLPWAPADWSFNLPACAPFVEVSSSRGVFEYFGNAGAAEDEVAGSSVQDALARGHRLGLISSSDCHLPASYAPADYAAAIAEANTREALWEAFLARRMYACRGAQFLLDFRVDGNIMGSEFFASSAATRKIEAFVHSPDGAPLGRLEVVRNNKTVVSIPAERWETALEWQDESALETDSTFYYLRVVRDPGRVMAWSSPVWVTVVDVAPRAGRLLVPPGENKTIDVEVRGPPDRGIEGILRTLAPGDWLVWPPEIKFRTGGKEPFKTMFTVGAPARWEKETAELEFEVIAGGRPLKALKRVRLYLTPWPEHGFSAASAAAPEWPANAGANFVRGTAKPGEPVTPLHFIRNWVVLGPFHYDPASFKSINCREALDWTPAGVSESELNPDPNQETAGRRWVVYRPYNLGARHYGTPAHIALDCSGMSWDIVEYAAAYLVADIYTPKELRNCSLLLGSDDYIKVWLNNVPIFTWSEGRRGADPDTDVCEGLTLQAGWNRLAVKLVNVNSGWSMFARFVTAAGSALEFEDDPPPGRTAPPRPWGLSAVR